MTTTITKPVIIMAQFLKPGSQYVFAKYIKNEEIFANQRLNLM